MKFDSIFIGIFVCLTACVFVGMAFAANITPQQTIDKLKPAIISADMATIHKHIAVKAIMKDVIQKRMENFGITGSANSALSGFATSQFYKQAEKEFLAAGPGARSAYAAKFKFKKFKVGATQTIVLGSWDGNKLMLSMNKNETGDWVITNAICPYLDRLIDAFLKQVSFDKLKVQ